MTEDEQRIAIAEACGWIKFFEPSDRDEGVGKWLWHKGKQNLKQPPDYLNDLNSMHEVVGCQPQTFRLSFDLALHALAHKNEKLICDLNANDWATTFLLIYEQKRT